MKKIDRQIIMVRSGKADKTFSDEIEKAAVHEVTLFLMKPHDRKEYEKLIRSPYSHIGNYYINEIKKKTGGRASRKVGDLWKLTKGDISLIKKRLKKAGAIFVRDTLEKYEY